MRTPDPMIAAPDPSDTPAPDPATTPAARVQSIDALRGLVMFAMIFVNDLAGVPAEVVPWWMRHFKADGNGMTFVDLVFPAFLFIVGMSIPLALGARLARGQASCRILVHVVIRAASLLLIGVLMVNGAPDAALMGWSPALWSTLMFLSAIAAFSSLSLPPASADAHPGSDWFRRLLPLLIRGLGFAALLALVVAYRGRNDQRIISLSPFFIHTSWYGILGLIGWAYLVGAVVFLLFRGRQPALLGCMVLLFCLYAADRTGAFDGFWLRRYVGIGTTLGSQAAITVGGVFLASMLASPGPTRVRSLCKSALLFVGGCAAAAWLLHGLYGINKNRATPSWCLWACAITAALWLLFHLVCDVRPMPRLAKPLVLAGENVLLAYLLSEMLPSVIELLNLGGVYDRLAGANPVTAVARSAGCALVVLAAATLINRAGLRLRL